MIEGVYQIAPSGAALLHPVPAPIDDRAERWPGVSSVKVTTKGGQLLGVWHDRTAQFQARRRGAKPDPLTTEQVYELHGDSPNKRGFV
jgi:hypothetical protein